ncbi:hypothetical protein EPN29_14200 [bacterium]|nr:MAG: hypothetical protein EPN29_14200 [bacterium]
MKFIGKARSIPPLVSMAISTLLISSCGNSPQVSSSATSAVGTTTTSSPSSQLQFYPVSFTAVSADQYWLLGLGQCPNSLCTSIVHTTDGGKHFSKVSAPSSPVGPRQGPGSYTSYIDTLRFVTPLDGFAFGIRSSAPLWATTDGGITWKKIDLGEILAFASSGGYAYAVTASSCNQLGKCINLALKRSPVGTSTWSTITLPASQTGPLATMAAHGSSLWISIGALASANKQDLLTSTDYGNHFNSFASPCFSDLGGQIEASSSTVLWAVCATGMQAGAFRSADGGKSWTSINAEPLNNSAQLAPADDSTAILDPGVTGALLRTADGGKTFSHVQVGGPGESWVAWIGFTTPSVGSALVVYSTGGPSSTVSREELWRTVDGGISWTGPVSYSS